MPITDSLTFEQFIDQVRPVSACGLPWLPGCCCCRRCSTGVALLQVKLKLKLAGVGDVFLASVSPPMPPQQGAGGGHMTPCTTACVALGPVVQQGAHWALAAADRSPPHNQAMAGSCRARRTLFTSASHPWAAEWAAGTGPERAARHR